MDTGTLRLLAVGAMMMGGSSGCGSSSKHVDDTPPAINGNPMGCQTFQELCQNVVPRAEITVTDGDGKPLKNVIINTSSSDEYHPDTIDPVLYPKSDGSGGRRYDYYSCTGDDGVAYACGMQFDASSPTKNVRLIAIKSGYEIETRAHPDITADQVVTETIQMTPRATTNTNHVLTLLCGFTTEPRDPMWLIEAGVSFSMPPFGKIIETLVPDSTRPLWAFDTLIIGQRCSRSALFGELLQTEGNQALWSWVRAGGRLLFTQLSGSLWDAANGCLNLHCAEEVFEPDYRFKILPDSVGSTTCDTMQSGSVFPGVDANHWLVGGVDFSAWQYAEYFCDPFAGTVSTAVIWDGIDRSTIKPNTWNILQIGKASSEQIANCGYLTSGGIMDDYPAVGIMEASLGDGHVVSTQAAWVQGTQALYTHCAETDPDALILHDRIVSYVRGDANALSPLNAK